MRGHRHSLRASWLIQSELSSLRRISQRTYPHSTRLGTRPILTSGEAPFTSLARCSPVLFLTVCRPSRRPPQLEDSLSGEKRPAHQHCAAPRWAESPAPVHCNRVNRTPIVGRDRVRIGDCGAARRSNRPLSDALHQSPHLIRSGGFSRLPWMLFPLAGSKLASEPSSIFFRLRSRRTLSQS